MKRLLLLLLAAAPLSALPLNNPMQPILISEGVYCDDPCGAAFFGLFNIRFGFYGDYIFDTHTQVSRPSRNDTITTTRIMTNAGEAVVNFCGFDIFATVGASEIDVLGSIDVFQTNVAGVNSRLQIHSDTSLSWSVGGRWAAYDCGCLGIGIEGQYFSMQPNINNVVDLADAIPIYFNGLDMRYSAWQVGVGVNYSIPVTECFSLNPYWGAFWTNSKMDFGDSIVNGMGDASNQNIRLFNLKKDRQYGWAFGLTMVHGHLATITAEGRWAGEKAAFLSGQVQF